jgi:hypothetical protein
LLEGSLRINIADSFHLNDSTSSLAAEVRYSFNHEAGHNNSGILLIQESSPIGTQYELVYDSIPAGNYLVSFAVDRPFVILNRKDNVGESRFADFHAVDVPVDDAATVPTAEIWAYRTNRLIVYFEPNVDVFQADSIIGGFGAQVLRRSRSLFDNALFYEIFTGGSPTEIELKPLLRDAAGVRSVYYDIFGHSYF